MSRTPTARAVGVAVGAALISGVSLGNLGNNLMPVLLPGIIDRFHVSSGTAGMVATVQLFTTAVTTLLLTPRVARPGRARVAGLGVLAAVAGLVLAATAPDLAVLIGANVLAGAGLGAVNAAGTAAIAAAADTDRASYVAVLGGTIVLAVLVLAVPQATGAWGGSAGFAVLAVCCAPVFWLVRALPDAAEPEHGAPTTPVPLPYLLALILLGASDQGAWSYSEIIGEHHAGMSVDAVSLVLAIASIGSLVGVFVSQAVTPRLGRLTALAVFIGAEGIAKLVLAMAPSGVVFSAAAIIWQICYMGMLVSVLAVAAAADASGRWVASSSAGMAIGTGLGTAPAGWILDAWGAPTFGVVLTFATAVAAGPLLRAVRTAGRACEPALEPSLLR
ncbi:MFS transporter [Kitasatospora cineracea]|uniref:Putative MFS family arabinose efflux permease n=1 Tax=Kitasatospora cineracea TaxID=88074 RepID=A0A8G1UMC4_9ACTN|nr:MFS transporter [Kitasatospora cineracea]ROR46513.1 putative MFS family arabinose efflux permease [Kitasatospora cineracea]